MGGRFIVALAILVCCLASSAAQGEVRQSRQAVDHVRKADYAADELIVKFRKRATAAGQRAAAERSARKHGSAILREIKRLNMQRVRLKKGLSVEQAMAAYSSDPDVEYAQPNYRYRLHGIPDDSRYNQLWNMARIKAPQAWDLSTGSPSIVVGTIDTGIDYNHPDLQANIWHNSAELSGEPLADDDGAGYVDDLYGWNTLTDSGDPLDDESHGTHVAGIIGAAGNNGIGVAGVNWNVRIMACKAFDNTGNGWASDIIECLQYFSAMKDLGVNLVATNNSYSGDPYDQAMIDAINLMPDVLFVAAASNDGTDNDVAPYYPAGYRLPNVISVAATDADDKLANFSNFGKYSVHVAAPGVNVVSTVPVTVDVPPEEAYSSKSGTSMAAPHVVGLAALIKAHDPSRDWKTIRNLILAGADPVASVADVTITGGRINALNSLACSNRTVTAILEYPLTITAGVPATLSVLNIRCGAPGGPVKVTIEGVGEIELADDGAGVDLAAADGIYTASWTPPDAGTRVVTVSAAGFSRTFAVPTLRIEATAAAPPAQSIGADTLLAPTGVPYSQTFSVLGGKTPLEWTATTPLPAGLSIDPSSGAISGTPTLPGNYSIAVQVRDALQYTALFSSSLTLAAGIRDGWPKTLALRSGTDSLSQFTFPPVLADLNGDGSDEIIVADRRPDSEGSALYLFSSSGPLAGRSDFVNALSTPAVADLDGDGTPEIIVAEHSRTGSVNPTLMIHVLDSQTLADVAWFTPGSNNMNNYLFKTVTVEDLDGDGTPEIIVMGRNYAFFPEDPEYNRNVLFVLNASGGIVDGWPTMLDSDTDNDRGAVVGDLYGTGTKQIVVIGNDGMVRIYAKDGTEMWAWNYNSKPMGTGEISVNPALADLDGDGVLEIIVAYTEYDSLGVQRIAAFRPDGTLLSGWPRGFIGRIAQSFSAADLFNEGKAVVILPFNSAEHGSELLVLRGDGSVAPGWPVSLGDAVFNNYHEPMVADVNGDGINEIIVNLQRPACSVRDYCFDNNAFVEAIGADGLQSAGFPKPIPGNAEIWSPPAVGDIDGDGRADILAKTEDGRIYAWSESSAYLDRDFPWPQYRHDPRHSGAASTGANPAYPTIDPVASPTALASQVISGTRPEDALLSLTLNGQPVTPAYPTATTWQASLGGMIEGANRIRVVAADGRTAVGAIVVDTIAPMVEITNPADGFISTYCQHMLSWRTIDSSETSSRAFLDGVELTITSGEYLQCLADGSYLLRVEVTDAMGFLTVVESRFTIDSTPPVVTLHSPVDNHHYTSFPQLLFSVTKAPLSTVEITLDGAVVSRKSGDYLLNLARGSHTLKISATDDSAQSSNVVSITFFIDQIYFLSLAISGSGGGSVSGDMACISGTICPSAWFEGTTLITLIPTPDTNSFFKGWEGACTNTGGNCRFSLGADSSVTATFTEADKVRTGVPPFAVTTAYATLLSAFGAVEAGQQILARAIEFDEHPNVARPVVFKGGFDAEFGSNSGSYSVVKGRVRIISGGYLSAEGLKVRAADPQ